LILVVASLAAAQFRRLGDTSIDAHLARPQDFDGRFHYCRAVYRANPGATPPPGIVSPSERLRRYCESVATR
jgi:hypothetical protein